jgi:hypothetical protein
MKNNPPIIGSRALAIGGTKEEDPKSREKSEPLF